MTSRFTNGGLLPALVMMLLALLGSIGAHAAGKVTSSATQKVESVRVWKAPDNMRLVFDITGPVEHDIFTLSKPDRVVIDVKNTLRTRSLFNVDLKGGPIKNLRSAVRNKSDLRIVLDLSKPLKTKSFLLKPNDKYGHRLVVDLQGNGNFKTAKTSKPVKSLATMGNGRAIVVVIDAGHGGEDPGAIGSNGTYEKHVVLKIAKELQRVLNGIPGYKAVLTRKGDYFLKLKTRRELARKKYKGDLFVSLHADAFKNRKAKGASVFALSRRGASSTLARILAEKENQSDLVGGVSLEDKDDDLARVLADLSMEGSMEHSLRAGKYVLKEMGSVARLHKKHVEQAGFVVLKSPDIPSLLVETGFISNPTEEKNLNSKAYRSKLAKSISKGIVRYFEAYPPPGSYVAMRGQTGNSLKKHKIERGETLSQIAAKYRVSASSLRKANAIKGDTIQVGQVLKIPHS
ncbi:MAG: N-acetylmuramoyl-L-alanine amidase [Pseudomonadales bacterium]|nr:N-acetylmuramoyl-L-alanine amidase [Pseudomonadales bacterium]